MLYSLIDRNTWEVLDTRDFGVTTPPVFKHQEKPWKWVNLIKVRPVDFDPATEVMLPPEEEISLDAHTINYVKRPKTPEELNIEVEAEKNREILNLDGFKAVMHALLNHENRLRALEKPIRPDATMEDLKIFMRNQL